MSAENKAMLVSWVKVFLTALVASFLAMQTPPWELSGDQWLAILWSGLLGVIIVVYNYLDPNDPRYGHVMSVTEVLPSKPVAAVAAAPKAAAAKRAPAPKKAPAKKTTPAKKTPAAKKAPAKKAAPRKANGK